MRYRKIITFDFVNDAVVEVDNLIDGNVYSYGESTDEQNYNSSLSTIAENIKEA